MADKDNKIAVEILLQTLTENPELWETRKKTAKLLYADKEYAQAADIIWNAPEIPATDIDVAFVLKMISRVKPNRSIRLIYEIVRRNQNKPHKNMAVARALNDIGMYMEAARFYGAALAVDSSLFDLGFERQMLWLDDSSSLIEKWKKTDQEAKPPLDVPQQNISGGMITPNTLPGDPTMPSQQTATPPSTGGLMPTVATQPLLAANMTTQPLVSPMNPGPGMTAPNTPAAGAAVARQATNPLLRANSAPPQGVATQPLMPNPVATQPLMSNPVGAIGQSVARPAAQPQAITTQPLGLTPQLERPQPIATQPLGMPSQLARPTTIASQPITRAANSATQPLVAPPVPTQPLAVSAAAFTPPQPMQPPTQNMRIPSQPLEYAPMPQQPPLPNNPGSPSLPQPAEPPATPKFKLK